MERNSLTSLVLVLMLTQCVLAQYCDVGQYYDVSKEACMDCTPCDGEGMVVKRTCQATFDTVCGPFYEFVDFMHEQHQLATPTTESSNQEGATVSETQWYSITLILIGVLCFMSLLLICLMTALCVMLKNRHDPPDPEQTTGSDAVEDYEQFPVVVPVGNLEKTALV